MNGIHKTLSSLLIALCLFCGAISVFAQGTDSGTIRGRVTDPNGASIPGASVKVTDLGTGIDRDLTTAEDGEYVASTLKSGTYTVTVVAPSFKTTVINVALTGSETARADFKLEIGTQDAMVLVTQEAGLIQTESPAISTSIENRLLVELPRENRDIYSFLFLNPNITQGPAEDSFKFIGAQSYGANFSLDGQRANGGIFGGATASQPSLEVIQELTVLSNNFAAEYGGIANIRVVTKRGGQDYHGSLFYNNRNSKLAAWRIQDKIAKATFTPTPALAAFPNPYFNLNETGGSFSGPVPFSRRTFFLGSYERRWDYAPVTVRDNDMPTSTILNGDFRGLAETARPAVPAAVLPLLTPAELTGNTFLTGATRRFNTIPTRLLNPIALNIVNKYYPQTGNAPFSATNGRLVDFYQNIPGLLTRDLYTFRVDHDFSEKDKFYAVYNYQRRNGLRTLAASTLPAFGLLEQDSSNQTLSLSYTRLFSPNVVNELRGGFNTQKQYRHSKQTTKEFLADVGFNEQEITSYGSIVGPSLLDTFGHLAFTIGPFQVVPSGARNIDRSFDQSLMTFGDTLTWSKGNHTIKAGADFVRNQAIDDFVSNRNDPRGTVLYPATTAGLANFLLGLPPSSVRYVFNVRPSMDVHNWENGFFVQDDFKINPRLTLNLGVRYELISSFVDKDDLMINFDPNGPGINGNKGRFIVPSADIIPTLHPGFAAYGIVTAKEAGVGRGLVKTDRNNLAPRIGLAWRVTEHTVIRGGYGVFYPTSAAQGQRDAFGSTAFNQRITKNSTAAAPLAGLPGGINPRGLTPFSGGAVPAVQGLSVNAIPIDLQSPRIEQFNATVEREIGWKMGLRVSYLGSRMNNLIGGVDLNLLPPSDVPFGTSTGDNITPCDPDQFNCVETPADRARRPFPAFGDFLASYGNIGRGRSHALQIEGNRQYSKGLTFNVSYTLLDQKSSGLDVGASSLGGTLYNQFNPDNDFGTDAYVSRHRMVAYGVADIPFGRGRSYGSDAPRALDLVAGGWQLSWNMFAKSGTGFTPYYTCSNCAPAFPGNIASSFIDPVGGFEASGFRATFVGSQSPYLKQGDQFFNPAAFGPPSAGADVLDNPNAARRNSLTGPGTWGTNLGLHKKFRVTETARLEVGADFNNVFNHPLRSPQSLYFANVGDINIGVNPTTRKVFIKTVIPNALFGRTNVSFNQEGIENRRLIRLRLRLQF